MATAANDADHLEFDGDAARTLFAGLDQIHLVAILPDPPKGDQPTGKNFAQDAEAAVAWAEKANGNGFNVYWTANYISPHLNKKPSKPDIKAARCAHCDVDPPKDGSAWDKAGTIAALQEHDLAPSIIIDSGNGVQPVWLFDEPSQNPMSIESINLGLREKFGEDGCYNIDRLLRVPGTINYPGAAKRSRGCVPCMASMVQPDTGQRFDPAELAAAFPHKPRDANDQRTAADVSNDADVLTADDLGLAPLDPIRSAIEHPPGRDRSGDMLACGRLMANRGFSAEQIFGVLYNAENGVSAHAYTQRDPRRAALRIVEIVCGGEKTACEQAPDVPDPVNLWARYTPPPLPEGLLPAVIERYARAQAELMGVDPGGLAMAALATCAAATPDRITVQVKKHDPSWREPARLWVALIGTPSSKKSPIMNAASRPLNKIDARLFGEFAAANNAFLALPSAERKMATPPKQRRLRISDATVEAAQEVLKDSPDGVLSQQDELSGWFGAMDKYGAGKGAMADRGFWLQAFNGGPYALNRVSRGAALIPNLSISVLGGIQPEPLRKIVNDAVDDGLIQRLIPVLLNPASVGLDAPRADEVDRYEQLVNRLWELKPPRPGGVPNLSDVSAGFPLVFDDDAHEIRQEVTEKFHAMMSVETVSPKLASHFGKYEGLFPRLCVLWHAIENADRGELPAVISGETAHRVARFLHEYIARHSVAFYVGVLGLADDHEAVVELASHILAHKLDTIQVRDIQRAGRSLRSLTADQGRLLCEKLESLGWAWKTESAQRSNTQRWAVNPLVHSRFEAHGREEAERRAKARDAIKAALSG
jgi:hypothetical protein